MKITNCNCGHQVECGCTVSFDTYTNNTVSVLSVGNLVGGSCTFDEYVIDWYRDGEHALVSGKGNDPQIQAFHPFTGAAAIPVPPGNWEPVLRYVVIDGNTVYPSAKKCKDFCLDLDTQLPSIEVPYITVNSLNCSTKLGAPGYGYDVRFQYQTSQDYSLASRTVHFYLDADTWAFAVSFDADLVADRVKVTHSRTGQVFGDFIVGTNNNACLFANPPYNVATAGAFKFAFYTPEYQAGDYLIIEVTPSVLESNPNTVWTLDLKCIKTGSFPFDIVQDSMRVYDIDTLSFVWEPSLCRFKLSINIAAPAPSHSNHYLDQYCGMRAVQHSNGWWTTSQVGLYHQYSRIATNRNYWDAGYSTKLNASGTITVSKSGSVYTWVCTDQADYLAFKSGYNNLMASSWATDFVNDPSNIKYFKYHLVQWITAANGCGDNEIGTTFYFHRNAVFTWDDQTLTITVTAVTISNDYFTGCDLYVGSINGLVGLVNGTITRNDFSSVTRCRYQSPFSYGSGTSSISLPSLSSQGGFALYFTGDKSTPEPVDGTWCFDGCRYSWFRFYFYTYITAQRDGNGNWLEEPTENFEVYRRYNPLTGCYSSPGVLIYKKTGGTVTVKKSYWEN